MKRIVLFIIVVCGFIAVQGCGQKDVARTVESDTRTTVASKPKPSSAGGYYIPGTGGYSREVEVHAESINRMCAKFLSSDSEEERYTLAKYIKRHNWEVPKELWSPYVPVVLKEIDTLHILDR